VSRAFDVALTDPLNVDPRDRVLRPELSRTLLRRGSSGRDRRLDNKVLARSPPANFRVNLETSENSVDDIRQIPVDGKDIPFAISMRTSKDAMCLCARTSWTRASR